jgi:hypothetical protein
MRLHWDVTTDDVTNVKAFLDRMKDNAFVKNRIAKNVTGPKPVFSKDEFWYEMLACLLTTQQRSGPDSAIARLIGAEPFPLSHSICSSSDQLEVLVRDVLSKAGGIRRSNKIAGEASENLRRLTEGGWAEMEAAWGRLTAMDDPASERETARVIDKELKGFGPKQARNLLQSLGLTRYEIPIDSRIVKWLHKFDFPVHVPAQALSYAEAYELILDGFQELCRRCEVHPCVLDAAIFASFDGDAWNRARVIG